MSSRTSVSLLVIAAALVGGALYYPTTIDRIYPDFSNRTAAIRAVLPGSHDSPGRTVAAVPTPAPPPVPVEVDVVQRGAMSVRIDAVGTAQPIATVSLKTRVDAQIDKIMVGDGAYVNAGDPIVKLDSRQIEAQIRQTEAAIAKDQTALDQANRDIVRFQDLFSKGSGTQINLDNGRTAQAAAKAVLAGDQALLENQKVQLSWYTLTAPISGHVGTFSAKVGSIIRAGDNTTTGVLTTIVQTAPIYVAFSVPQTVLTELREAVAQGHGEVQVTPQGSKKSTMGKIAVLDNTIDAATGTIMIRAVFENNDDLLWPGQLCNVRVTVRTDPDVVSIPRIATQSGQTGNFVFVVDKGVARIQPVRVGRFQDGRDVIVQGLNGGETIVSDGGLLLTDGARINPKNGQDKKGSS